MAYVCVSSLAFALISKPLFSSALHVFTGIETTCLGSTLSLASYNLAAALIPLLNLFSQKVPQSAGYVNVFEAVFLVPIFADRSVDLDSPEELTPCSSFVLLSSLSNLQSPLPF